MEMIKSLGVLLIVVPLGAVGEEIRLGDGTKFVSKDDNPYGQLCLAALESREAMKAKASGEHRTSEKKRVAYNDLSLFEFADKHREDIHEWAVANVQ